MPKEKLNWACRSSPSVNIDISNRRKSDTGDEYANNNLEIHWVLEE